MFLKLFVLLLCLQALLGNIHQIPVDDDVDVEFLLDDMILSREQMDDLFDNSRRNAVVDKKLLWPNKIVPVLINDEFSKKRTNNSEFKARINRFSTF